MLKLIYVNGDCPTKLNFGCGNAIKEGWFNLDVKINESGLDYLNKLDNTWIAEGTVKSPGSLPYEHFENIESVMCMEHLHPDMIPNTLFCLYKSLKPNGKITIIVPNFLRLSVLLSELDIEDMNYFRKLRNINNEFLDPTFEDEGFSRGHQSIWTPPFARYVLTNEGFVAVGVNSFGEDDFYLRITATKLEDNPYGSPNI